MRHLRSTIDLAVFLTMWFYPATTFAQEELKLRNEGIRPYTVEIKPLPTALSAVPGIGSIGVGSELFFSSKSALFVDGQYTDANLPNRVLKQVKENNTGEPIPRTMIGYNVTSGVRFYSSPALHSWYGALGVGYSELTGKWDYDDATVQSHIISVLPTVAAGFRWVFENNVILRLGANFSSNIVKSESTTAAEQTATAADGVKKVSNSERTPMLAAVDVGLGYGF